MLLIGLLVVLCGIGMPLLAFSPQAVLQVTPTLFIAPVILAL